MWTFKEVCVSYDMRRDKGVMYVFNINISDLMISKIV